MAQKVAIDEVWQQYRRTRDKALRDRLILNYAPLVKYVAGRLGTSLPAHVDEGDLNSYGLLGLIGAIERFDPEREIKFETYAINRIKGSIIDELRSLDWVPRSGSKRSIAPISPSSPYEMRSPSSTCAGRPVPSRPATYFTSGA